MVLGLLVVLVVVVVVVGQLGHNILADKLEHKWLGMHLRKLVGNVCPYVWGYQPSRHR